MISEAEIQYPSKLLNDAVREFAGLPAIGSKTALRLVLFLLKKESFEVERFAKAIIDLKNNIKKCKICKNISDEEICEICADTQRDEKILCVVENINDVIAIEKTRQFHGLYHVLGGLISPMDGLGPSSIEIDSLEKRLSDKQPEEIILALNATPEGETTNYYIQKKIKHLDIKITKPSTGMPVGGELQYIDELTLGRSLLNRTPF